MNFKLILYSKYTYQYLKKEYENKGFYLYSFFKNIHIDNNDFKIDKLKEYNKIVLDISSLILLIQNNESNIFTLEKFFYFLEREIDDIEFEDFNNFEIIFISDNPYKNIEDINYTFRNCFNEIKEYTCNEIIEGKSIKNNIDTKIKKVIDFDENNLDIFFKNFEKYIYGHDNFKKVFINNIHTFRLFNKLKEQYILSFFLMGPSGVGKTEVAKAIHKSLGCNGNFIKINFGNYSSSNSLNSLIGSPRGYIGSENGELFNKLSNSDSGVILIDEFEKANNKVFNYFLEMLETGKATNSQGEEFDLNGYIIIFTSNIKENEIQNVFSPELISRFNCICHFNYLTIAEKKLYIENRVNEIISKYTSIDPNIKIDNKKIISNININLNNIRDINFNIRLEFFNYIKQQE